MRKPRSTRAVQTVDSKEHTQWAIKRCDVSDDMKESYNIISIYENETQQLDIK